MFFEKSECLNCKFFKHVPEEQEKNLKDQYGICRRMPPSVLVIPAYVGPTSEQNILTGGPEKQVAFKPPQHIQVRPNVLATDSCGEFRPRGE